VDAVAFSADGTLIAAGGQDKTIRVWHVPRRTVTEENPTGRAAPAKGRPKAP
jgi:WD40 repeat protein